MSAAGRSSGGFQVLDVGVNVRLQLADFVYRSSAMMAKFLGFFGKTSVRKLSIALQSA